MDLHVDVLAGAEGAANAREVQPHLLLGKAEARRDLLAVHMQPLGRHVQVDAAVLGGDRQTRFRSERRLILHAGLVVALDPDIGRGTVRVAVQQMHVTQDVAEVVQPWRVRAQRLLHVREDRQRRELDGDTGNRAAREFGRLRGGDRDGFAVITDDRVGKHGLVVEVQAEAVLARNVTCEQHGRRAGARERPADVDVADRRMRVRRPEGRGPQHAVHPQITRIRECPAHLGDPVDARHLLAHAPTYALPQPDAHRTSTAPLHAPAGAAPAGAAPCRRTHAGPKIHTSQPGPPAFRSCRAEGP